MYKGIRFLYDNIQEWRYYIRFACSFRIAKYNVEPWLNFGAIDYLNSVIADSSRIFEYGSGRSTLYFGAKNVFCYTVEHSSEWFGVIKGKIPKNSNLVYNFVPAENSDTRIIDPSDPDRYESDDPQYRYATFKQYVQMIDRFPDNYFDVVLIDGRARPSCIKHASRKVKIGGCMVLDDSDRAYYLEKCMLKKDDFNRVVYRGIRPAQCWVGETSIFIRSR